MESIRFNPPTDSWWGEFWERLVGAVEKPQTITESLPALYYYCEAVVCSGPLTQVSEDHEAAVTQSLQ